MRVLVRCSGPRSGGRAVLAALFVATAVVGLETTSSFSRATFKTATSAGRLNCGDIAWSHLGTFPRNHGATEARHSQCLIVTGLNVSGVKPGDQVHGVSLSLFRHSDSSWFFDLAIALVLGGPTYITYTDGRDLSAAPVVAKFNSTTRFPSAAASFDLWGLPSLTPQDVTHPDFGFILVVGRPNRTETAFTYEVLDFNLTVSFTPAVNNALPTTLGSAPSSSSVTGLVVGLASGSLCCLLLSIAGYLGWRRATADSDDSVVSSEKVTLPDDNSDISHESPSPSRTGSVQPTATIAILASTAITNVPSPAIIVYDDTQQFRDKGSSKSSSVSSRSDPARESTALPAATDSFQPVLTAFNVAGPSTATNSEPDYADVLDFRERRFSTSSDTQQYEDFGEWVGRGTESNSV